MVNKQKQRTLLPNLVPANSIGVTPTTNVGTQAGVAQLRREKLTLSSFVVAVLAANDYGGAKLCDLPNTNLLFLGVKVDLTATVAGTGSALANVDFAIGTVTTASAAFSNTGEKNIVPKIDCTSGGDIEGASDQTTSSIFIAAGSSNALYANCATGNITTDGNVTLSGTIELIYLDLGKAS